MTLQPLGVRVRRTLRLGPAETLAVARRQADTLVLRRVMPIVTRVASRLARVTPRRDAAAVTFFGVTDGHTLNLQVALPDDGFAVSSAELVLRQGRTEHRTAAALRSGAGRPAYAQTTALLGNRPGAVPLGRGAWDLRFVLTSPDGGQRRVAVRRTQPEPPRTGPTVAAPPCPDTGTRFRPVTTALGACRLVVTPGRPAAEVVRFVPGIGRAEIIGRFVGVGDTGSAFAEFRRTGDGFVRAQPMRVDGDVFRIELPLTAMMPSGGEQMWEIWIRPGDGSRLRVGRFLHDLRHIRRTLPPYERPVLMPGGAMFHLRLQYTLAGRLNLICTSADTGDRV